MSETTRQRVEAEAEELYPDPTHYGYTENLRIARGWLRAAHVRAKTVNIEQVEAAAWALFCKTFLTGDHSQYLMVKHLWVDWAKEFLRAAGFIIEGEE